MYVKQTNYHGAIYISQRIEGNEVLRMRYYGYTRGEAIEAFKRRLSEIRTQRLKEKVLW